MLLILLQGIFLGSAISIPFGPVNVVCFERTIAINRQAGFRYTLGATTADAFYAWIACTGIHEIIHLIQSHQPILKLVSGTILLILGSLFIFINNSKRDNTDCESQEQNSKLKLPSFLLAITNPLTVIFFFGYLSTFSNQAMLNAKYHTSLFVIGVIAGSALWFYFLSWIIEKNKNRFSTKTLQKASFISYIVLCISGAILIINQLI
jgi:threonine/homoserine/homoserine lactone efflux protein